MGKQISLPQFFGLKAVNELRGVRVFIPKGSGRGFVSPIENGAPVDAPNYRTIKALHKKGLVEIYNDYETATRSKHIYYRITAAGKAVLNGG